jgi:hypothetical protein
MYLGSAAAGKGTRISGAVTGASGVIVGSGSDDNDEAVEAVGAESELLLLLLLLLPLLLLLHETRERCGTLWNGVNAWTV